MIIIRQFENKYFIQLCYKLFTTILYNSKQFKGNYSKRRVNFKWQWLWSQKYNRTIFDKIFYQIALIMNTNNPVLMESLDCVNLLKKWKQKITKQFENVKLTECSTSYFYNFCIKNFCYSVIHNLLRSEFPQLFRLVIVYCSEFFLNISTDYSDFFWNFLW